MSREAFAAAPFALALVAWLLTYLAHSTVALGGAWLLDRRLRRPADRDALWKAALLAALLTSTAQSTLGYAPLAGQVRLDGDAALAALGAPATTHDLQDAARAAALDRRSRAAKGDHGAPATGAAAGSTVASRRASPSTGSSSPSPSPSPSGSSSAALPRASVLATAAAALPLLWALVAALLLLRLVAGHRRLRRQLDDRRPLADEHLLAALSALAAEAGLRARVRLTATARCSTPLAIGRREVCVPERFLDELAPPAQRAALAHEVAHLARRDPFWQLLASALEAFFFLQPLHRLARRRLRETAELLCDDWAAASSGGSGGLDLAQSLLAVSEWLRQSPLGAPREVLAMAEGGPGLALRIERLLAGRSAGAGRAGLRAIAAAVVLLVTAAAAPAVVSTTPASDDVRIAGDGIALSPSVGAGSGAGSGDGQRGAAGAVPLRRAPVAGLEAGWRWAEDDAAARGESAWWLAWSTAGRVGAVDQALEDSAGNAFADLRGPAIVRRLGVEDEVTATVDAIVVFVQRGPDAERPLRVAVRSPYLGMRLRGPVYWLGPTPSAASLERLAGLYESAAGHATGEALIETIALHETPAAVDFLAEVLDDGPDGDRAQAAEGLTYWPGERATAMLYEAAAQDRSEQVAAEAAETLGEMPAELALPRLRALIWGNVRTQVGLEAVEALGDMRDAAGADLLDEVVAELPREALVREAVESLGALPRAMSETRLRRVATEHPMRGAREEAWETLGESAGEQAPELEYEYQHDGEYEYPHDGETEHEAETEQGTEYEPLVLAAAAGNLTLVERLLTAGDDPALVDRAPQRRGDLPRTALGAAARGGHRDVAELLLAAGAPVDLAPPGDPTPLMYAAEGGHVATMELLLAHGGTRYARDPSRGDR